MGANLVFPSPLKSKKVNRIKDLCFPCYFTINIAMKN